MLGGKGCDKKRTSWRIGRLVSEDAKTDFFRHKDKKNIFSAWFSEDTKTDFFRHKDIKNRFEGTVFL